MLKTIIRLPDGTEISSGSNTVNAIKSVTLTECVNSGEDLTIGSTCANALEATLITPNGGLSIAAGNRITVLKQDGNSEPVQVGVFNLEKPTRPTANTMKLTGYDRVVELDKDLTDWLNALYGQESWSYTLITFAGMVCTACGLTFKESEVPNASFPVPRFTRSAVTGRQLMQWLGEICCRFCRADPDGNIEFAWYEPSGKTITPTGDLYYLQNGLSYEDYKTAKIDVVQLRLANSRDGALWPTAGAGVNSYIITDNAILNAKIADGLQPYLRVIKNALAGVEYTPCKVTIPAGLDIHAGNTVQIIDKNGNAITAYVMTKTQTGQKDTLECTGNIRRDAPTAVSNQAKPAGSAAQDAFNNMTQEQIFKKLTEDGNIQGLFMKDGQMYLNLEYLTTGTLKGFEIIGEKGTIGGFTMSEHTLSAVLRKDYPEFTQADLEKLRQHTVFGDPLTDEEIANYDLNLNGWLEVADASLMSQLINGTRPNYSEGRITLDATSPSETIILEFTEGLLAGRRLAFGPGLVKTYSIHAENYYCGEERGTTQTVTIGDKILTINGGIITAVNDVT